MPRRGTGRQKGAERGAREAKRVAKVSQESPWDPQAMQKGSSLEPQGLSWRFSSYFLAKKCPRACPFCHSAQGFNTSYQIKLPFLLYMHVCRMHWLHPLHASRRRSRGVIPTWDNRRGQGNNTSHTPDDPKGSADFSDFRCLYESRKGVGRNSE